ncbi:MAG TPA: carbamoyltransferase HypF, partial [candidate division Zixibacteria bacterium]|nr:carbamoyltransferase HypF [candidate division Zixibacteria bacterium]
ESRTGAGPTAAKLRRRLNVNGIVQGIGFRPFVYRLAKKLNLVGFVINDSDGVVIEVEGPEASLDEFLTGLQTDLPVLGKIVSLESRDISPCDEESFRIEVSRRDSRASTLISPDIATCPDCLVELFEPGDRRYRYPFINCTNCGPRYTIVEGIPYDRPNTSMRLFPMCPECATEYRDPDNRRFHAQPNACPECGPRVLLHDGRKPISVEDPIQGAVDLLKKGQVVAVRGVGGFHLTVDVTDKQAIEQLRLLKGRAEKPFALMSEDIEVIKKYCHVSSAEVDLLGSHARPIVLLRRREDCALPNSLAPNNKYLGFMLAYTPLHHLLLHENFEALVMTSANYSEEPIAIGNQEAFERLSGLVDAFLVHDREIRQRCDDSVAYVQEGRPRMIRRSRGYVPTPVFIGRKIKPTILACGGELKNTIALSRGDQVFFSQHIGDLDNPQARAFFENSIEHLSSLLEIRPEVISHDLHPEYLSTKWAEAQSLPTIAVQHHHAHLASVMAENQREDRTIGIILDGTGYGTDGTIWGGEVLIGDLTGFERFAWLKPVPMPGGSAAIKQPWRMAVSCLHLAYDENLADLDLPLIKELPEESLQVVVSMIEKKINAPKTSSCGRLFDAVAAILGIRTEVTFEAQAAIELEMAADEQGGLSTPGFSRNDNAGGPIETAGLVRDVVKAMQERVETGTISALFHRNLANLFVQSAIAARSATGIDTVALSGGVYQNRYFTKYILDRLVAEKFTVLEHRELPVNDGGLALGQIVIAAAQLEGE